MGDKTLESLSTETLRMLSEELEEDLLLNEPKYRDLLAVRTALAERGEGRPKIVSFSKPVTAETPYRPVAVRLGRVTAVSAAVKALKEAGRPMTIHELVEAVQKHGFEFTGKAKSPPSALAIYLSKPKEKSPVVSVWIDNRPYWWLRDQPVPGAEVA